MKWRTWVLIGWIVSGLLFAYSFWFISRVTHIGRTDPEFPRAFPFPDHLVIACEAYFEEKNPTQWRDEMFFVWAAFTKASGGTFLGLLLIWGFSIALKKKQERICAQCSYDLRGSLGPECPECGKVFVIEVSDQI